MPALVHELHVPFQQWTNHKRLHFPFVVWSSFELDDLVPLSSCNGLPDRFAGRREHIPAPVERKPIGPDPLPLLPDHCVSFVSLVDAAAATGIMGGGGSGSCDD